MKADYRIILANKIAIRCIEDCVEWYTGKIKKNKKYKSGNWGKKREREKKSGDSDLKRWENNNRRNYNPATIFYQFLQIRRISIAGNEISFQILPDVLHNRSEGRRGRILCSFVWRKEFNTAHYHKETRNETALREVSTEEQQLVAGPCTRRRISPQLFSLAR